MGAKYKFCVQIGDEIGMVIEEYWTEYEFDQFDYGKLFAKYQVDSIITKDKGWQADVSVSDYDNSKCGHAPFYEIQDRDEWEVSQDILEKLLSGNPEIMIGVIPDTAELVAVVYDNLKRQIIDEVDKKIEEADEHYGRQFTELKEDVHEYLTEKKQSLDKSLRDNKLALDKSLTQNKNNLDKALTKYKKELDNELTKLWKALTSLLRIKL